MDGCVSMPTEVSARNVAEVISASTDTPGKSRSRRDVPSEGIRGHCRRRPNPVADRAVRCTQAVWTGLADRKLPEPTCLVLPARCERVRAGQAFGNPSVGAAQKIPVHPRSLRRSVPTSVSRRPSRHRSRATTTDAPSECVAGHNSAARSRSRQWRGWVTNIERGSFCDGYRS